MAAGRDAARRAAGAGARHDHRGERELPGGDGRAPRARSGLSGRRALLLARSARARQPSPLAHAAQERRRDRRQAHSHERQRLSGGGRHAPRLSLSGRYRCLVPAGVGSHAAQPRGALHGSGGTARAGAHGRRGTTRARRAHRAAQARAREDQRRLGRPRRRAAPRNRRVLPAGVVHPAGRGGAAPPHRLHQRREPPARAGGGARARGRGARGDRREPAAARDAVPDREPARRGGGGGSGSCPGRGRDPRARRADPYRRSAARVGRHRRPHPPVRRRADRRDGCRVRPPARVPGLTRGRAADVEGRRPHRGRQPRDGPAPPRTGRRRGRAGGDAARGRGAARPERSPAHGRGSRLPAGGCRHDEPAAERRGVREVARHGAPALADRRVAARAAGRDRGRLRELSAARAGLARPVPDSRRGAAPPGRGADGAVPQHLGRVLRRARRADRPGPRFFDARHSRRPAASSSSTRRSRGRTSAARIRWGRRSCRSRARSVPSGDR